MNEIMITKHLPYALYVGICARQIARKAVQQELRDAGVRVSLVKPAAINEQATEYIRTHPEIWAQALERARRIYEAEEAEKAARRKIRR
jgi:NAD(P)-dependent dehydrogenase (short-subunit alcohol dehydrogenase family)